MSKDHSSTVPVVAMLFISTVVTRDIRGAIVNLVSAAKLGAGVLPATVPVITYFVGASPGTQGRMVLLTE